MVSFFILCSQNHLRPQAQVLSWSWHSELEMSGHTSTHFLTPFCIISSPRSLEVDQPAYFYCARAIAGQRNRMLLMIWQDLGRN